MHILHKWLVQRGGGEGRGKRDEEDEQQTISPREGTDDHHSPATKLKSQYPYSGTKSKVSAKDILIL